MDAQAITDYLILSAFTLGIFFASQIESCL